MKVHSAEPSPARASTEQDRSWKSRPWWPWLTRLGKLAFFSVIAWLLVTQARAVQWDEVLVALRQRPKEGLLGAALLALASYLLYSSFDLLGRYLTGHGLRTKRVMAINFVSYAFNLNLGTLVGGVASRYRLYARFGLGVGTITRITGMSIVTNWLGYLLLGGLVFVLHPLPLPSGWSLGAAGLRAVGAALLLAVAVYLGLCSLAGRRIWRVRGHDIMLPSWRMALLQLVMSSANWLLIAGMLYLLLERKIGFASVLGTLLVSAIAGVITHVPAGLGVLEAVFVALLSREMPKAELLAALLSYRAIYYLVPLAVATLSYIAIEASARALEGAGKVPRQREGK